MGAADGRRDRRRDAGGDRAQRLRQRGGRVHELRRRPRRPALRPDQRRWPAEVTYAEAFTVQPFGNTLVVKTCTGQQIYDVLNPAIQQPGTRVEPDHAAVGGERHYQWSTTPLAASSTDRCRSTAERRPSTRADLPHRREQLQADGGDNYTVFRSCASRSAASRPRRVRALDAHKPVAPPPEPHQEGAVGQQEARPWWRYREVRAYRHLRRQLAQAARPTLPALAGRAAAGSRMPSGDRSSPTMRSPSWSATSSPPAAMR